MSIETIIRRHFDAFQSGDLDRVPGDCSTDAILIANGTCMAGVADIQALFQKAPAASRHLSPAIMHQVCAGEVCRVIWSIPSSVSFGTDAFVVRSDKIVAQTFAAYSFSSANSGSEA